MKKFVCTVCGYVYEGDAAPAECPVCHVGADKFKEVSGEKTWAAEHVVGVAKGVSEDILADLRANFEGECSEVGMYLEWQELLTEKVILKSVCTGRKQLMKRLNMLPSLQNSSVKLLQTAQRRILR